MRGDYMLTLMDLRWKLIQENLAKGEFIEVTPFLNMTQVKTNSYLLRSPCLYFDISLPWKCWLICMIERSCKEGEYELIDSEEEVERCQHE
jgi:hypothetical protein